jgi:hypothetical protein
MASNREPTPKQRALAMALASGSVSKAEAYRAVYDTAATDPKLITEQVRTVTSRVGYQLAVDEIRAKLDRPELRDAETTRQFVRAKLFDLATNSRIDTVQLGAAVKLGEIRDVSAFTHGPASVDPDLQGTSGDIREAVARQIQQILEQAESGVIDVPRSDISGDTISTAIDTTLTTEPDEDDDLLQHIHDKA